jgi:hypothetical protein
MGDGIKDMLNRKGMDMTQAKNGQRTVLRGELYANPLHRYVKKDLAKKKIILPNIVLSQVVSFYEFCFQIGLKVILYTLYQYFS